MCRGGPGCAEKAGWPARESGRSRGQVWLVAEATAQALPSGEPQAHSRGALAASGGQWERLFSEGQV